MMPMYTFKQLSETAQDRAVSDYLTGWQFTQDEEIIKRDDIREFLISLNDMFDEHGRYMGGQDEFLD